MAQVLEGDVGAFKAGFTGTVLTPSDPDYDQARWVWNGAINRRPSVIARCSSAEEVVEAVKFGRRQGLEIAVRGGGHNFAGFAVCEGGLGTEALRFCRDAIKTLPDDVGLLIAGLSAPPAPFVPEQYRLAPGYALLVVGFGSAEEHQRVVQPIREALPPRFELVTPIPYVQLQRMFDEGNPWGIQAYEKALYLDELTDDAIAVFAEHLPRKSSPLSFVPVFVMGGAYGRVGDDATAFGGSRAAGFAFNIAAVCPTPELLDADRAWVRSFWQALRPHASGSGSYVNFMAEYEEDRVRAAYGAEKYERLARIKAAYDPDNVFHLNANIKPAVSPA